MADSNITKKALSSALKSLLDEKPFAKISVGDICEKCDMNRKSFYYHFQDKYDLVNWIFDTEFLSSVGDYETGWDLLNQLCAYFYDNRSFYRRTLSVEGQNSFTDYFKDILTSIMTEDLEDVFGAEENAEFFVDFYADAFVCAFKKWLSEKDCRGAQEFADLLRKCLLKLSHKLIELHPIP